MFEGTFELFSFGKKAKCCVTQTGLEDMFYDFFQNELYTIMEDGSIEKVTDTIWRLWKKSCENNFELHRELIEKAKRMAVRNGKLKKQAKEEAKRKAKEEAKKEQQREKDESNDNNNNDDNDDGWAVVSKGRKHK